MRSPEVRLPISHFDPAGSYLGDGFVILMSICRNIGMLSAVNGRENQ
jgi:hypothetical protein